MQPAGLRSLQDSERVVSESWLNLMASPTNSGMFEIRMQFSAMPKPPATQVKKNFPRKVPLTLELQSGAPEEVADLPKSSSRRFCQDFAPKLGKINSNFFGDRSWSNFWSGC